MASVLPLPQKDLKGTVSPILQPEGIPSLIQHQLDSFHWFCHEGLKELLEDISPIRDFTQGKLELYFTGYIFRDPKHIPPEYKGQDPWELRLLPPEPKNSPDECRNRDLSYAVPLWLNILLGGKEKPERIEQWVYVGDFPWMMENGTFIINGAERVVVSQLLRSPGVFFNLEEDPTSGQKLAGAKLIPDRGGWLELETSSRDVLYIKLDGKHRVPITALLQALGYTREELEGLFSEVDNSSKEHHYLKSTLDWADSEYSKWSKADEGISNQKQALNYIYSKLHPGDPINLEAAQTLVSNFFTSPRRYSLGNVGRYKLNRRLGFYRSYTEDIRKKLQELPLPEALARWREKVEREGERNSNDVMEPLRRLKEAIASWEGEDELKAELVPLLEKVLDKLEERSLTPEDLVEIVRHLILVNNGEGHPDNIDHLGNRRVRTVGELLYNQCRIGLLRLERVTRERMTLSDPKIATPVTLINIRPLVAALREFFGSSQLSQFMDQTNPLAELTHKRRLSAMGPGGLPRERAGFEVRDVHYSHYGRICPIETPEGPNIGLIGSMAVYSRVNSLGFLETPYRPVVKELENSSPQLVGRKLRARVTSPEKKVIAKPGTTITQKLFHQLSQLPYQKIAIVPCATPEVLYLSADKEEEYTIAQAKARLNEQGEFLDDKLEVRQGNRYFWENPEGVDFMDVSPQQIVSLATSLIPFLEHDDANRALMGSNMQRQAVPLLRPKAPLVGTEMERIAARDSGQATFARRAGVVTSVTASEIRLKAKTEEEDIYPLKKFERTNQGTCLNQRPVVKRGERVEAGQLLADSSATDHGELALGQNLLVAFMSWRGYNFEDAIVINEDVVRNDLLTSIHIERSEAEARETKLGPEEFTRDIPNVGEESLRNLDENGIIRVGAQVGPGDILAGKITHKGETELTAEEKLLRTIFGEKVRDVKDTSLRVPHGEAGTVIGVKVFSRDQHPELGPGVLQMVRVWVAQRRKISVGDKLAGRHGNKGVVSKILPPEDMPFLPDGRPISLILNPIGVPSRMNLGQILETHLGGAAHTLGWKFLCPVFQGADSQAIEDALAQAWIAQRSGAANLEGEEAVVDWQQVEEWLKQRGYAFQEVFSPQPRGKARQACLKLWLEDQGIDSHNLSEEAVEDTATELRQQGKYPPILGKVVLRDGHTGKPFDQPITVGHIYLMKLVHQVEDKIHARSTGPYSLITQQPLGGKAQFGGQRFGEMEVWALEAYGAKHILQELLTVKSDDIPGRAKTYEALVKGEDIIQPGVPESFRVLSQELKSLGLGVEVLSETEEKTLAFEELETPRLDF